MRSIPPGWRPPTTDVVYGSLQRDMPVYTANCTADSCTSGRFNQGTDNNKQGSLAPGVQHKKPSWSWFMSNSQVSQTDPQ